MTGSPADIVNRALDAIGRSDIAIGELQEGTEAARPALRAYGPAMRQLLRGVHWDFARKMVPLNLLADSTGQTANVGTAVPQPWVYEYEYPIDCMKMRFVPWQITGNQTTVPIVSGLQNPSLNLYRLIPAPFLLTTDYNYPVTSGPAQPWGAATEWWDTQGTGPVQRTVILSNVQNAQAVYTAFIPYPSQWDSLFEQAMVSYLASLLAAPLARDPKSAILMQRERTADAKAAIMAARVTNGNEAGWPQKTDHIPDWMRVRNMGAGWGAAGFGNAWPGWGFGGWGGACLGWDPIGWADGSVY